MEYKKQMIDANDVYSLFDVNGMARLHVGDIDVIPRADAVEVVHGRWLRSGGDLHSSGYAIDCSVCNKTHFVHYKHSLGSLYGCKELFEKPNYCPNCGAKMDKR